MNWFAEERAEGILLTLGITGCPSLGDIYRIRDLFRPCLEIEYDSSAARASVTRLPNGVGLVRMPSALSDWEWAEAYLHELAHYTGDVGLAARFAEAAGPPTREALLLGKRWAWTEENYIRHFTTAVRLPSRVVHEERSDGALARRSQCSLETVRWRRGVLSGRTFLLDYIPKWSAAAAYRVLLQRGPEPAVLLRPRQFADLPTFWIPMGPDGPDRTALGVTLDLMALNPTEFGLVYAGLRLPEPEPYTVDPEAIVLAVQGVRRAPRRRR